VFRSELQYGFAKNKDISISLEPTYFSQSGKLVGNVAEISYFENITREIDNAPAFGYRVEAGLPVSGQSGSEFQLRAILTKSLRHYDKIHFNLDVYHSTKPSSGDPQNRVGAILGYSTPLGYPRSFDQTLLAEWGVLAGSRVSSWVGVGLRKQVSATAVVDLGFQLDLAAPANNSSTLRLTLGYSQRI
jgi:hypothetical protein